MPIVLSSILSRGTKERLRRTCSGCSCVKWSCWSKWRTWMTDVLFIGYCLVLLLWTGALIYNIYVLYRGPFTAWYYMAFIVMSTLGLSMTLRQYQVNYTRPDLQCYIIRIAFYMPVYGFISVST